LDRMINTMFFTKRHGGVGTIDTAGAGIGQMWRFGIATGFNNIGKAYNIAFDIAHWVFKRIAYTCLCCQMNHAIKLMLLKTLFDRSFICEVSMNKIELPRLLFCRLN